MYFQPVLLTKISGGTTVVLDHAIIQVADFRQDCDILLAGKRHN